MVKVLVLGVSSFAGGSFFQFIQKKKFVCFGTYNTKKNSYYWKFKKKKLYKINFHKRNNKLINLVKKIKPKFIVDFASLCMVNESWSNSETYFNYNVVSKIKLIENLKKLSYLKKYIYISTPEIFGSSKKKIAENSNKFQPNTPYASSKLAIETILTNYAKNYKSQIIISRFSNFYGRTQPIYRLIPQILYCIKNNKKFRMHGNGSSKRNFIFEDDFNNGIFQIIKKGLIGKIYHFTSNNFYRIKDVVKLICKIKKVDYSNFVITTKERIGKDQNYFLSASFTKKKLKWYPRFSLRKGIKTIIKYFDKNYYLLKKSDIIYKFIK
jgi:dTDP-glucose 4,6-dehydratase